MMFTLRTVTVLVDGEQETRNLPLFNTIGENGKIVFGMVSPLTFRVITNSPTPTPEWVTSYKESRNSCQEEKL